MNSGDGEPTDMVMEVSRIQPLNPPQSPVTSTSQLVVELPSHYEAPALPINITTLVESVVHLSQIFALSSVPMSPNRVRAVYTFDTVAVFPVFQVSPDDVQYLSATSQVTPPASEWFRGRRSHGIETVRLRERLGHSILSWIVSP